MNRIFISFFAFILFCTSCATVKTKGISYMKKPENSTVDPKRFQLNVFTPKNPSSQKLPVLIFIHGGYWNSGNKDLYGFFGRNFAKKEVITVIPNYVLSPNANYDEMTEQITKVINWTKNNINNYGGNADQIYLTGHSAGGHLIALATMNSKYDIDPKAIKGIILNDAAGLNMYDYLQEHPPTKKHNYLTTWTDNPENWKKASPRFYISENTPKMLIYVGDKTHWSIIKSNERFAKKLSKYQPDLKTISLNKSHIPMITQYFFPWSDRFDEIVNFMETDQRPGY